jgi:hypothetical protein
MLEARTLLSSTPTGAVNEFSTAQISGWAINKDDGQGPVDIEITINGTKTILTANGNRSDLINSLKSPFHGFTFTPPELPMGTSTVTVVAISESTGVRHTLKTGTLTTPVPTGKVELFSPTEIKGWAYDPSAGGPVDLRLDIDGVPGTVFAANVTRTDISGPHHYNTSMLGYDIAGDYAGHVVELFAIDSRTNGAKLLYTNNKKPAGKVEVNDGFTVSGYAQDPDNPTASINVRVDIDGVTLTSSPANVNRPDLTTKLGSGLHGFSVTIPGLTPGKHTISVYALDGQAGSQAPVLIGSKSVMNLPPIGAVEVANGTTLSGWAADPDLHASPATINVYVDDKVFGSFAASTTRNDLTKKLGSPDHGFTVDLSSLPQVSHAVTVTVDDNRTSNQQEVVIFDGFINNHGPTGSVTSVTGNTISGWAFDQDAPDGAVAVDVYVDGVYRTTFTADQPDAIEDAALPTPNHAFTGNLPPLSFGKHRVDLYASESQGNFSVLIGSRTVTNQRPIGMIESANATTITGWAADPDVLGSSISVKVYVNGVLATTAVANVDRQDLVTKSPLKTMPGYLQYGYSITLPTLAAGRNQIDVFAVDVNNELLVPLGSSVLMV